MINRTLLILLALSASAAAADIAIPKGNGTQAANGVTLADCYQKALKVSETLAISEQDIRQLEAQYREGVGSVLPDISWQRTDLWQDTSKVNSSSGGVQGTLLEHHRPESFFRLR